MYYRKTIAIEPALSPAANNLSWIMAEQEDNLDEALSFVESTCGQQEDNPRIVETIGWIYIKECVFESRVIAARGSRKASGKPGGAVSLGKVRLGMVIASKEKH